MILYAVNFVFHFLWSPLFFNLRRPDWGRSLSPESLTRSACFEHTRVGLLLRKASRQPQALGTRDNQALIGMVTLQAWHRLFIESHHPMRRLAP